MDEKRITQRLLNYWKTTAKGTKYPDIKRLNTAVIEDIWPFCFRVAIIPGTMPTYRYEYMGQEIIELYGRDLTNQVVDSRMAAFPGAVLHEKLDNVVATGEPLSDDNHMVGLTGKLIKYRACMLPFGNEQSGVTHIVTGLSCRFF